VKAVVTGGGGFLGRALVARLLARGDEVTSVARGAYPELERAGVHCVRADLAAPGDALERACAGAEVVFHCAAKAGVWGPRAEYFAANVEGTRNVLAACRRAGVSRLVHTSSPSVCFDGADHRRASNDLPHATRFRAHYPASKARAEAEVLRANAGALATCALRPHLVFGPGDPHILPRLIARARAGALRIIGSGGNEVSLTYVDNAAAAHVAAADRLAPGAPHAGRAYFVCQAEPVRLWSWINELLVALGIEPVTRRLPYPAAYALGATFELAWHALRRAGEPPLTRFVAAQLARSHSYDLAPARADFGYVEEVDLAEATRRTVFALLRNAN
jgi:nucleoside-diphosphate-sugar epimerase